MIQWTSFKSYDPKCENHLFLANADGHDVSVRVSEEVMENNTDPNLIRKVAERKIANATCEGIPPRWVQITTADLSR